MADKNTETGHRKLDTVQTFIKSYSRQAVNSLCETIITGHINHFSQRVIRLGFQSETGNVFVFLVIMNGPQRTAVLRIFLLYDFRFSCVNVFLFQSLKF